MLLQRARGRRARPTGGGTPHAYTGAVPDAVPPSRALGSHVDYFPNLVSCDQIAGVRSNATRRSVWKYSHSSGAASKWETTRGDRQLVSYWFLRNSNLLMLCGSCIAVGTPPPKATTQIDQVELARDSRNICHRDIRNRCTITKHYDYLVLVILILKLIT